MNLRENKWNCTRDYEAKSTRTEFNITSLYFPSADVLFAQFDKLKRAQSLVLINQANALENQLSLKIIFEDIEGPKSIVLENWTASNTHIIVQHGGSIPVHRINKLKLINSQ